MTDKHQKIADEIAEAFRKVALCMHDFRFDEKSCQFVCKKCRASKTPLQYALWLKGDKSDTL